MFFSRIELARAPTKARLPFPRKQAFFIGDAFLVLHFPGDGGQVWIESGFDQGIDG